MSAEERIDPLLTTDQVFSPQGCGAGTEGACYALTRDQEGSWECMVASGNAALDMAGIKLGWRMNFDTEDDKPWCPKGIIPGSKVSETPADS